MRNSSKTFGKLTIPLLLLLAISFSAMPAQAKYGGGTGEPNDPYLIFDANQMNAIGADSNDWDNHFLLCADIDLSGFTGPHIRGFSGVFDGNGHTISNFTYTSTGTSYIGLFGVVGSWYDVVIKNLGLIDPHVDAGTGDYVGSLVGYLYYATITDCYVEGGSVSSDSTSGRVGGLVGGNHSGHITNCYSTASVTGGGLFVGGLVGMCPLSSRMKITNCYSAGSVVGVEGVGGLVGYVIWGGIYNSYSTSDVSGYRSVGGLVGDTLVGPGMFQCVDITNCYAAGSVSGTFMVGALVGTGTAGCYTKCFWDSDVNPDLSGIGNYTDPNVIGKTTTNMQTESTYTDAGWDFVDVWGICEGQDYPRLSWEKYGGGNGTADNPYLIYTSCQMNEIGSDSNDWAKHFKLMSDIDLSGYTGTEFNTIGYYISSIDNKAFTGVFDGNGHTISNFSYTATDRSYTGLFEYVSDPNAEIKNLVLIDPNINAKSYVASLVGYLERGTLTGCSVDGGSISEGSTGGLVGINGGTITDCSLSANIYGTMLVGGLVAMNDYGNITNCHSNGTVSGISQVGGGFVGSNSGTIINCGSSATVSGLLVLGGLVGTNSGAITTCYASGGVSGQSILGGLVGLNRAGQITDSYATSDVLGQKMIGGLVGSNDEGGSITNCYAAGHVSGDDRVGGMVGSNAATITDSFWDTNTSDVNNMCGSGSGCDDTKGKITSEMQTESTFTSAGWDFVNIWDICEGTNYPKFAWQIPPGDFLCPDGVNFFDYSFFAAQWAEDNCGASNDCDGRDLDLLGTVDIKDLRIFADNWLAGL
ncbi:MAG: hypothetical protein JSV03_16405 [Planctomycetota bacterium]|nr:MAG: hypothetical protein JSV03_16405 [Planctomycetota bacterium]